MRVAPRALRLLLASAALLIVGMASTASAAPNSANASVSIKGFAFSPSTVTVNIGEMVTWTNNDAVPHSGDTAVINPGGSASHTYATAGTFVYHCSVHPAMTGTVVVQGAATPPPTPQPTPVPTAPPTPRPTIAPTAPPTTAPTPGASAPATPAPTSAAPSPTATTQPTATAATPSATTAVPAAAAPSGQAAPAAAAASDDGPGPLLLAGGAIVLVGLIGVAFALLRR